MLAYYIYKNSKIYIYVIILKKTLCKIDVSTVLMCLIKTM